MTVVGLVIEVVLSVFLALMFVRVVMSWVMFFATSWSPTGPFLVLLEAVYSATDPPINLVRRYVSPLRVGEMSIDVAFILVFFVAVILQSLNRAFLLG